MDSEVEQIILLTEDAASEVNNLRQQPDNQGKTLRVYVEKGGCSGMQYGLVFDEKRDNDIVADCHGVSVLVDEFSAKYLRGSVVDFSDSLNSGGFKITNPQAAQSCGCGRSFESK